MTELPKLAVIRHRCHCPTATVAPGKDDVEHVFTLDGVPFPWFISEDGPVIRSLGDDLYTVTVSIMVEAVDCVGVDVQERT